MELTDQLPIQRSQPQSKDGGHLEVVIKNCKLRTGNTGKFAQEEAYFMLLQLDEQTNMLKP